MRGRNWRLGTPVGGLMALALGLALTPVAAHSAPAKAPAKESCVSYAAEAEQKLNIPTGMLLSIALVESGMDGVPTPYAVSSGGRVMIANTGKDAAKHLRDRAGRLRADTYVGCMQLSVAHHQNQFRPVERIVEPRDNVWYAARMLLRLHGEEGSWRAALSRYNGGNTRQAQGYICKVWQQLSQLDEKSAKLIASPKCEDSDGPSIAPGTRRIFRNAQVAALD